MHILDNKKKAVLLPIFLFLLALVPRIWKLDVLPPSMIHDELNYVMNAKSLSLTGKNIPWTASALFSWGERQFDVVISEIPSWVIAPYIGFVQLNQFNARIMYAVSGAISVVMLYLITKNILNKKLAIIASVFMSFNPWSVHLGRTALEVNFALMFFLMGFYLIVANRGWKIFLSFPFFLMSFLSYLGAKLLFLPLIIIILVFHYLLNKPSSKNIKIYLLYIISAFFVVFAYWITIKYQPAGSRTDELLIFENEWTSSIVNDERRQSIPNVGMELFTNKAVVLIRRVADVYLKAFSPIPLFSRGETISVYSTWQHGQFYYIDFFLIIAGLIWLYKKKAKVFWLISFLILLSPSVSSIDLVEETYAIRAFPMFPMMSILSACGVMFIFENIKFKKGFIILFGSIYLISVCYFLNLYFYRYPAFSSERWFLSEKIISRYLELAESDQDIENVYIVPFESKKVVFEEHLFYSGKYDNKKNVAVINEQMKNENFSIDSAIFSNECPKTTLLNKNDVLISEFRKGCVEGERGNHGILDLKDAGTIFIINNDLLCDDVDLPSYYRVFNINDFKIETMNKTEFCSKWIVDFNKR